MEKREKEALKKIKYILKNYEVENDEKIETICGLLSQVGYSNVLSQKLVVKILLNSNMTDSEKKLILNKIIKQYPQEKVENYILFVETMLKIEEKYLSNIREIIRKEFDSLYIFMAVIGMYTYENPEIIEFSKEKLIELAHDVLKNDITLNVSQSQIIISDETYLRKRVVIDNIYKMAIKLGCIIEKFDDISFSREEIVNVNLDTIPFFELEVTDWSWKRRLMFSSEYYTTVAHIRNDKKDYETDAMYNYYKCYICKKSTILNLNSEVEDIIQEMLKGQFAAENMFQMLVRYVSPPDYKLSYIASYGYSIYLLLYIEQLFLLLVDRKIYRIYEIKEIKNNMFGSNFITEDEFEQVINIFFQEENKSLKSRFYRKDDGIVIGSWMFNHDFSVPEKVMDLVFNTKRDKSLGREVNTFGKKILEMLVKGIAKANNWKTVESAIKIKNTDFDLVAYKDGNVILGQVKACHTTRKTYSLWKANEVILEANEQVAKCKKAIEEDEYLLYSNLKREKIVSCC